MCLLFYIAYFTIFQFSPFFSSTRLNCDTCVVMVCRDCSFGGGRSGKGRRLAGSLPEAHPTVYDRGPFQCRYSAQPLCHVRVAGRYG